MKIGIIGCGTISSAYFGGAQRTDILEIKACADIRPEAAQAQAKRHNCQAFTVDELLADVSGRWQLGRGGNPSSEQCSDDRRD